MLPRTDSLTLSLHRQESFASSRTAARSTEPEVFTFERIPTRATAVRSFVPIRPKKRCTRVMYPAKVRMHLPPPERSLAKRWLLVLSLVLLWQIYTEEPCVDAAPDASSAASSSGSPAAADLAGFPFRPAEEPAVQLAEEGASPAGLPSPAARCETSDAPEPGRDAQRAAGNGYMVALLVYHRLGQDS